MAVSKVILNGTTLMDVTQKTVVADKLLSGYTALKNDGTDITGSYTPPSFSTQSKTVSPSTSQQTVTADGGYDGLSSVTVNAISPTKAAQTYTPGTSNQTISSGRWLTGTQTILGDANLVAGNIKSGTTIFGVTGTYSGGGGGGVNTCTLTIGSDGNVTVSNFDTTPSGDYMVTASVLQSPAMYTDYNGTESFFFDAGFGTYIVATIGEGVASSYTISVTMPG